MPLAKTLMVQGTASSVGKSTLVAGLCRLFAQDGWRVAPFKAQNMALNAAVTPDGGEIGRAQAMQAEAAGVTPTVEMNPILLKPEGHARSQVIVMGRPLATMEAQEYYRHRTGFLDIVQQALQKLREEYDLVILEGAGSPVEINLAHYDLVNMRVAQLAEAPVMLVGDIDRGGIFAALLGTLSLLQPEERVRVKGLIVNKFRGDLALWRDGEQLLASKSGVPILGTLPWLHNLLLPEEDSVTLDDRTAAIFQGQQKEAERTLQVVLIRLPYLSNYDEFDALAADPLIRLYVVATLQEFPSQPDLIILPGTKNTIFDLAWLWRQGLAQHIRQAAKQGCAIMGICGGYQMLGERLSDPTGTEATTGTVEPGLGLLPIETVFGPLSRDAPAHGSPWTAPPVEVDTGRDATLRLSLKVSCLAGIGCPDRRPVVLSRRLAATCRSRAGDTACPASAGGGLAPAVAAAVPISRVRARGRRITQSSGVSSGTPWGAQQVRDLWAGWFRIVGRQCDSVDCGVGVEQGLDGCDPIGVSVVLRALARPTMAQPSGVSSRLASRACRSPPRSSKSRTVSTLPL